MKKIILFSLIGIMLAGGIYIWKSNQSHTVTYLTETVSRGHLQKSVIASGTVRAYQRVEVGAQVSGKIEKIHVKLGQVVNTGDLIAEIDSKTQVNHLNTAQAQLISLQAQLKAKKVALDVARSAHTRIANLYRQKAASLDDFNTSKHSLAAAEADIENIQAAIKSAEIDVSNAQTNLEYTKIVAPINGTIISIPVSVGQTVNANQTTPTIVQIADLSKVLIKPEISEGDITKVQPGMNVHFSSLSEPDKIYQATIESVDPAMTTLTDNSYKEDVSSNSAVYYYANIVVDNPHNKLRIGMTTQNTITIANIENTLLIPTMTLQRQGKRVFVDVLVDDNKVERREVSIGLNDDIHTQILSGLQEGDRVVASQVRAGEQVGNSNRSPRLF